MIPGTFYSPATVQVLAGDRVHWMNHDSRPHTATADGGAFDTGSIAAHGEASVTFPVVGSFAYTCRIHPFMHGTVDVVALVLAGPTAAPAKGAAARLTGRAAAGIGSVVLERATGATWTGVTSAATGGDGTFAFSVRLERARDLPRPCRNCDLRSGHRPSGRSPRAHLRRAARPAPRTRWEHGVAPAAPGTLVVFQRYVPERFAWATIARRRADRSGLARLRVRAVVRTRIRAVVRAGGLAIASPTVRIGRRPPFG